MANKKRGEVEVLLDGGSPHILRFDYNGLCELEEACGAPLMYLLDSGGKGVAMGFLREAVVHSITSLPKSQRTRKRVGAMLGKQMESDSEAMLNISKAVMTAIGYGMGRTEEEINASFNEAKENEGEDVEDVEDVEEIDVPLEVVAAGPPLIGQVSGG